MEIIDWPAGLGCAQHSNWNLMTSTQAAGRGLDGRRQLIRREDRYWMGRAVFDAVWGKKIPLFRATIDAGRGMTGVYRIKVPNICRVPYDPDPVQFWRNLRIPEAYITAGSIPFSDGARFSDGSGFALPVYSEATAAAAAPAGASSMQVTGFAGINMAYGLYFSVNDFLYRVQSNDFNGGIKFNPPLRQAIAAGTVLETQAPTILARLASDDSGFFDAAFERTSGPIEVDFEEVFAR